MAIVWSQNLQKKYPQMTKGDSFTDNGRTYYTAKFTDKETGLNVGRKIVAQIWEDVEGDSTKFITRYTGLPEDSEVVKNYEAELRRRLGI